MSDLQVNLPLRAVVGFPTPLRKVKVLGEELGYNKVILVCWF